MNILIINASPKGDTSVTVQTARYWSKLNTNDCFETLNVAQKLRYYSNNISEISSAISRAQLVVFCYPVYTFLAPYQLHKLIELMIENSINLKGKYVAKLLTSKHFYDTTAMEFVKQNVLDLGAKYVGAHSADMDDLLTTKGQIQAKQFYHKMKFDIVNNIFVEQSALTVPATNCPPPYTATIDNIAKTSNKDIVIVTNDDNNGNLQHMIADFVATTPAKVRVLNVRHYAFSGGCLGCLQCTVSGHCIYKDGFEDWLRNEVQCADAIVYAYTISNHFTHSSMKCYDDRQFCNGHRAVTMGKPTAYIISGNYQQEYNLRVVVEARSQVGGNYLAGVVTDESTSVENDIVALSGSLMYALDNNLVMPTNFYSAGGNRIFRDLIYTMRGMMKADHKFYVKHKLYDFPHKQRARTIQIKLLGAMLAVPDIRKKILVKMNQYAIMPYDKMLSKVKSIDSDKSSN